MKKVLLATIAVLTCLSQAEARDSLPSKFHGERCSVGGHYTPWVASEEADECPQDSLLKISSYRLDWMESGCDILKVKVEDKFYRVTSVCWTEGEKYNEVDVYWLENNRLRVRSVSSKRVK
jgi:hypothetical protein